MSSSNLADTHEDIPPRPSADRDPDTSPGALQAQGPTGEPGWVAAAGPFLGVWTLVADQSHNEDGNPLASATQRIEIVGGRVMFRVEAVLADGWDVSYVLSRIPDGIERPHPDPDVADIVSARIIGRTFETVSRRGGRVIRRTVRTASPDGERLTVDQTGFSQFGEPYRNRSVYQRSR
jgi:hypothetical protein